MILCHFGETAKTALRRNIFPQRTVSVADEYRAVAVRESFHAKTLLKDGVTRPDQSHFAIMLPVGRYRARFQAVGPIRLPAYAGSAWRGAFGHALKRAVCVTHVPACCDCLLYRSCGYAYVFETPLPPGTEKMRKYPAAPHPFVLDVDLKGGECAAGSPYDLGFTLIGRGNQYLPYIILALQRAGEEGIGAARGRFELGCVEQQDAPDRVWRVIYEPGGRCEASPPGIPILPAVPGCLTVTLDTPLRLRRDATIVNAGSFSFTAFFSNLLRRISMLSYFHTDTPLETDFAALVGASRDVPVHDPALRWFDWTRYSSRQKREMALGGLLGTFRLEGAGLDPFWPYLWLGQYVHAGAVTTMGLGRYRLITAASLPVGTAEAERAIISAQEGDGGRAAGR